MRKSFFIAALFIIASLITSAQLTYGIKAGFTTSGAKATNIGSTTNLSSKSGLQVGLTGSSTISKNLGVITSLVFTQKGYVETNGKPGNLGYSTLNRRISYIETPFDIVLNGPLNNKAKLFIGTGLAPAIGIADKLIYDIEYSGRQPDRGTTKIGFGGENHYRFFDIGWNVLGGFQFKNLAVTADYDLGLLSVIHDGYGQPQIYNRTLAITASYYFLKTGFHK